MKLKLPKSHFFFASMASLVSEQALAMPPVYVVGEDDTSEMRTCLINYDQVLNTAKAALRFNRVPIASEKDYIADKAIQAYVNLNVMELTYASGKSTGACAVNLSFHFETDTYVKNPVTGSNQFATIVFCRKASLITYDKSQVAARVKENVTNYVNSCVTDYEKRSD